MLARMQRKRISFALLVEMQAGAATLQNCMEVPQKTKNRTTPRPSNCTTRHLSMGYWINPWDTWILFQRDTCTPMFIAALSTIAKVRKEPKCPSMDEWIKKMWYTHTHTHTHTHTQWSITQQSKRMKSCHLQLRGWNWRVLCQVKIVRDRQNS